MKGRRFGNTQQSCFENCKSSYIVCSALQCGQFVGSQRSLFQASKRTNMGSAVLESVRCANIHEFCFEAAKLSDIVCVEQ